jgi:hypothetical protein
MHMTKLARDLQDDLLTAELSDKRQPLLWTTKRYKN